MCVPYVVKCKWIMTLKKMSRSRRLGILSPSPTLSIYTCKIIHLRNTHVVFTCGFHCSSDIYNVGAFAIYRRINLWVPCFVYNSNFKNIFFDSTLNVSYFIIYFKKSKHASTDSPRLYTLLPR